MGEEKFGKGEGEERRGRRVKEEWDGERERGDGRLR